ncbi:hypothetical protein PF008_g5040 [Phytophthora fragariae]|uniref:Uncharacterized protein n=1 Tax=Phytophthora fragariae TaxID=53985 RepID=A0A6G0SBF7_9STRA|nr:hypothetical protein PF008_g5040 [Phytophthora fragariae]
MRKVNGNGIKSIVDEAGASAVAACAGTEERSRGGASTGVCSQRHMRLGGGAERVVWDQQRNTNYSMLICRFKHNKSMGTLQTSFDVTGIDSYRR